MWSVMATYRDAPRVCRANNAYIYVPIPELLLQFRVIIIPNGIFLDGNNSFG